MMTVIGFTIAGSIVLIAGVALIIVARGRMAGAVPAAVLDEGTASNAAAA